MNINIKATNLTLTPHLSDYLSKRLDSLYKYIDKDDGSVQCDVELSHSSVKDGKQFCAEINLFVKGRQYRVAEDAETIEAAIDEMKDEVARELGRDKRRYIDFVRRGGALLKDFAHGARSAKRFFKRK